MNQYNFKSIIEFIVEFFSELPPSVVSFLCGFGFFCLMAFCGYMLAFVVAFFAFAFTQSATISLVSFIACIVIFSLFGIIQGYRMFKGIKLNYEKQGSEL